VLGVTLVAGPALAEVPGGVRAFRAPSFTTSTLSPREAEAPLCVQPDCARRKLDARTTVRLQGEFGSFTGRVTSWGPDSLAGFTTEPDGNRDAPAGPVAWSEVMRVERQRDSALGGAVVGALIGGLSFTAIGAWAANQAEVGVALPGAAFAGTVLGAFVGAVIGSASKHWEPVYVRP
jgi:hypothetical protein